MKLSSKRNPRIVYGSISGFGQYGPYTSRPSIDQIAQGMSGIMSVTGIPGQGPVRVGVAVTDIMAGAFLAQGILIALLDREVSGQGRWVQTSLIEAGLTLLDFQATRWTMDKKIPPQEGNNHPTNTPMGCFPTADGHINIAATSNKNFTDFLQADRPRDHGGRSALRLDRVATAKQGSDERDDRRRRCRPGRPANGLSCWSRQVFPAGRSTTSSRRSPTHRSRRCASGDPSIHPRLGELDLVAQPCEITGFDREIRTATPDLGEHNHEILGSLGYSAEEIEKLKAARAI